VYIGDVVTIPRVVALFVVNLLNVFIPGCGLDTFGHADGGASALEAPALQLRFSQVKRFDFSWAAAERAEYYQLLERADRDADYEQIGADIVGGSISLTMPLHLRFGASYVLRACSGEGCVDSEPVEVADSLAAAVGYFKASTAGEGDWFGYDIAVSRDGNTLAVSALFEEDGGGATDAGAVYVFTRSNEAWSQQAYLKASNAGAEDGFGTSVALSADGNTLAVGAYGEDSAATGINGDETDEDAAFAGAAYVFVRSNGAWSQQAYLKAANSGAGDAFGGSVAISDDGDTLAVGADGEKSNATGIDGDGTNDAAVFAGAVYVFLRSNAAWSQQAYLKASNTGINDNFGTSVAMSADGDTLAVGADGERSAARGVDGDQANDDADRSGAVYIFARSTDLWSQTAYLKASNTEEGDGFGTSVAMSADGTTLAVGAPKESSAAIGVEGDQADELAPEAGAVYMFVSSNSVWSQQAYLKASNTDAGDAFGSKMAVSADGRTLAVGALAESSAATGIDGDQANNAAIAAGAVYVFAWSNDAWSQQAYVKASNTGAGVGFGRAVAMSADGKTLAAGAWFENGAATGIGGSQVSTSLKGAGAVYLF